MTPRHRTGQLATFPEREDTTLPAGNPMTAPTAYAAWSPAVPPLVLLSAWLAGLGVGARRRARTPRRAGRSEPSRHGGSKM